MTTKDMANAVVRGLAEQLEDGKWAIAPSSRRSGEIWVIRPVDDNTQIVSFTITVKRDDNIDTNEWMKKKIGERDGN